METIQTIFEILSIIVAVISCGGIIWAMKHVEAVVFHKKYKECSTPYQIWWLNHPSYKGRNWMMQFNKNEFTYGENFKLTLEYYKERLYEFRPTPCDFRVRWKQLNDKPNKMELFDQKLVQISHRIVETIIRRKLNKPTINASVADVGRCTKCRFNINDRCTVGTYYAEQGKNKSCIEGELWETIKC